MWKRVCSATGGGMGKQLNYYMGYDEFITVAQAASDNGCTIISRTYENNRWNIKRGDPVDIVSDDQRDYFFVTDDADDDIFDESDGCYLSEKTRLNVIEAGFSIPDSKKRLIMKNRLYLSSGVYDANGSFVKCSDTTARVYNKLARIVRKLAPYTEVSHLAVNPLYENQKITSEKYITPYYLSLVKMGDYILG